MKDLGHQLEMSEEDYGDTGKLSYKTVHSYLYSFSLEKLNHLVSLKYFALFFCHYFNEGILAGRRVERKQTMRKHYASYTAACNLILKLCQETLRKSMEMVSGQ